MTNTWRVGLVALAVTCLVVPGRAAGPITYDFEGASIGTFTPFAQTVGGVTATFSSPLDLTGPKFSVQSASTTFFTLSLFSGRYLYPNNLGVAPLRITFSAPLGSISLTFATAESHIASRMYLSAYLGATPVGTINTPGAYIAGDTYPQGTITFDAAVFDRVELSVPPQGAEPAVAFMVDTVVVNTAAPPAPALQATWNLEEGDGQVAADSVGTNVGQLGSTPAADANDPSWGAGRTGGGLSFAGTHYLQVPTAAALSPGTITLEAWVRSAVSPGVHQYVVAKGANPACTTGSYGLRTGDTAGLEFLVYGSGGSAVVSPPSSAALWDGRWHFAAATFDGLTARLFIDGEEIGAGTAAPSAFAIDYTAAPDQRLAIGSYLGGACGPGIMSFAGDIDQVSLWSGALTAADIAQRFLLLNLPFATETILSATPAGTSNQGEPVVLAASVTSNNGAPAGTVEFLDGADSLGIVPLVNGAAELTVSTLTLGSHTLSASFAPETGFDPSVSGSLVHTVVAPPPADTTTTLGVSPNPSVYTQEVTLTAAVAARGGAVPTGDVQFLDGGTLLGVAALSAGTATLTTSTLPVGSRTLTALFVGNPEFASSTSDTVSQIVEKANTATTLAVSPAAPAVGQVVTLTATVGMIAPASGPSSGDVGFYDGAALLGTVVLAGEQALLTTSALAAGSHRIVARYAGTPEANASESAAMLLTVSPAADATATVVTSSSNPVLLHRGPETVKYRAAVAPLSGTTIPTGTVAFYDNGVLIETRKLHHGEATVSVKYRTAGTHVITAAYSGSDVFSGSTSAPLTVIVTSSVAEWMTYWWRRHDGHWWTHRDDDRWRQDSDRDEWWRRSGPWDGGPPNFRRQAFAAGEPDDAP